MNDDGHIFFYKLISSYDLKQIGGYMNQMIIVGPTYSVEGRELKLYKGRYSERGFFKNILDMGIKMFWDCRLAHNKVFFFTITLKCPVASPGMQSDNELMRRFCQEMSRQLSFMGYDPAYFWVRERDISIHNHYHLALWLNGSVTQHPGHSIEVIKRLWERYVGIPGCVHYYNAFHCAVMLRRNTPEHWDCFLRAFEIFSYFAKVYSKEPDLQLNCRHYGYSQPKVVLQYAIFPNWEIPEMYRR